MLARKLEVDAQPQPQPRPAPSPGPRTLAEPAGRKLTLMVDEGGYLASGNLEAGRFFGFDGGRAAGRLNLLEVIAPQERHLAAGELGRCLRQGQEACLTYTLVHQDGRRFPARLSSQPRLCAGRPVGMFICLEF